MIYYLWKRGSIFKFCFICIMMEEQCTVLFKPGLTLSLFSISTSCVWNENELILFYFCESQMPVKDFDTLSCHLKFVWCSYCCFSIIGLKFWFLINLKTFFIAVLVLSSIHGRKQVWNAACPRYQIELKILTFYLHFLYALKDIGNWFL